MSMPCLTGKSDERNRQGFQQRLRAPARRELFYRRSFDRDTLDYVVQEKIEVNAGSLDMLRQLGERSSGHRVWLRINPGFGHGHSKKTNTGGENSKHGIWHEQLTQAIALIKQYRLHLVGFHLHIGSGVDYRHLERVCQAMTDIISSVDHDFEAISAGGGLSVPYKEGDQNIDVAHYFSLWDQTRQHAEKSSAIRCVLRLSPVAFWSHSRQFWWRKCAQPNRWAAIISHWSTRDSMI